mmetsp:Transcript_8350/g.17336  ORF Transcript_8350/g.17336 Transcript_8350/m.17336 type:complete len:271 (+) Transcript_8350:3-815(+)
MRMGDFSKYVECQDDDTPLYLFDHMFANYAATRHLADQYQVPELFAQDILESLGPSLRPPYRWLLIGPSRSGSFLHKDPLGTSAWNALVKGTKLWVLFPPHTPTAWLCPEHRPSHGEESAACWFLLWWREVRAQTRQWPAKYQPIEFVQRAGEVVFVPARWWHTVLNLEDTIAVTHNFCSSWNLRDVWRCTGATHPVLARHFRNCLQREHPGLHREMTEQAPDPSDDPSVSYIIPESDGTARGKEFHGETSSSSDEAIAAWQGHCTGHPA